MSRLFVVSNRLPITVDIDKSDVRIRESSGGLASALKSVFATVPGTWIGWPGTSSDLESIELPPASNAKLVPVYLDETESRDFYSGFCNEIVWPLFHDLQSRCNFDPSYWQAYVNVNKRFARAVLDRCISDDLVWVHDYHLALMGSMLRDTVHAPHTAYFQHIPFPAPDIYEKLPWGDRILESMLDFSVVGFQTDRDLHNFAACVKQAGAASVRFWQDELVLEHKRGTSVAKSFPISIDYDSFASGAASEEVEQRVASMRTAFGEKHVVLGVDRLDYTKGIPERLRSFARALELYPELRRNVCFVQVVVPSRESIPKYHDLKLEIERLVSEINGCFSDSGWVPIHFIYRHLDRAELLAYYRLSDCALITPLKDGMNLVCKEYCAAKVDSDGVLILSKFAGAAAEFSGDALVVNPNDYDSVARQIHVALNMGPRERAARMANIRLQLEKSSVHHWVKSFLGKCSEVFDQNVGRILAAESPLQTYMTSYAGLL